MDKTAIAERLRALAKDDEKRSKAARLRDVFDDVEIALAAGAKHADVLAELNAHGLDMSLATFETTLKRLRAKQAKDDARPHIAHAPPATHHTLKAANVPASNTPECGSELAHDPAELDRILSSQPDLAALAKLAKRSRK